MDLYPAVANAAKIAAEHLPAVERAYVFGGPTDLFLLHDQASVRLAMQNYGKTPAVIRGWLVEFVAQEPRGAKPGYDKSKRTVDQRDPRTVQAVLSADGVPLGNRRAVLHRRLYRL